MTGESGDSTRAASVEPETETAHLLIFYPIKKPKTLGCLDTPITPNTPVEAVDRPTSLDVALPQHLDGRVIVEDEHGTAVVANPLSASTPPLSKPSGAGPLVLEEEEWEIRNIVGKRRAGKGYEYRVRWKDT